VSSEESPTPSAEAAPQVPGLKKKNLIIIGLVAIAIWAFAIQTGSIILMSIVGVLTLAALALLIYILRMARKQKSLVGLLQGAALSPEKRREAIAALAADKDANQTTHIFARAQLVAVDDPAAALAMLEPIDLKKVQAQMQDDVAILKVQLYLHFGRTRDARPLADTINVDNPQRAAARNMMVAAIAEAWGRTGKHTEALALLDTIDLAAEPNVQLRAQLLSARAFARFAAGKRTSASQDLKAISDIDINMLGKFLMPQFRVHTELQKLARGIAEKHPTMRKMQPKQRRGRPA
jgi:hypothetical protein